MVGDRKRREFAETIREAADKAGTLVVAALTLAGAALLIACVALVVALKVRVRYAG